MFSLKTYQNRAVEVLESFLIRCHTCDSVKTAYHETLQEQSMPEFNYKDYGFSQIPYVCLRIPTGGGKTLLGSYAIELVARKYLHTDAPITLWLVPTNTIRLQTVEALKMPGHPYRAKLDAAFNHQVLVFDVSEVTQIRPQDIGSKAIVVVSTIANLRVHDTTGRKVYAHHENFESHFSKIPMNCQLLNMLEKVSEEDVRENGLSIREIGKIKFSFANILSLCQPLVIVDEAHNARTLLTFDTLRRIHPAVIIEFTATPNTSNTNGSNLLFHVSAAELKAEEMIKLPIVLTEHKNWQEAIRDAVITRNKLEIDAQKDKDYIRPIALFQAEAKNSKVTVELLNDYLINQLHIDKSKISIATGYQRELDGIDLFDSKCPIEYIITIEALKEGWDCSFAYVFCSVKQVSSSKDAEQLLGRVLRMPYARRRVIEDLNRAYAHLAASKFCHAAQQLTDRLIAMGFEEMEVAAFLKEQVPSISQGDLFDNHIALIPKPILPPAIVVELPAMPDIMKLSKKEQEKFSISKNNDGSVIVEVSGEISNEVQEILKQQVIKKNDRKKLERDIRIHNQSIEVSKAPSENGKSFGSLPLICIHHQSELELVEPEFFLHWNNWSLLDYPAVLPNFCLQEKTNSFSIDLEGKSLSYKIANARDVFYFNQGLIDVTESDLICWLDRELRQADILQSVLIKFLSRLINNLLKQPNFTLTALVRNKFTLSRAINDLIKRYRNKQQKIGYQESLFGEDSDVLFSDQFLYEFNPSQYPSRSPHYCGRYKFQKHYFPQNLIEDLKSQGEEYECARVIDNLPQIKYWIRNLVKRDHASFWLPLAHSKFYPDFICKLHDGRMLVVEYKGEIYVTNDDSAEKRAVGNKWAELSNGKCLFIMAVKKDGLGRSVRQQIVDCIG